MRPITLIICALCLVDTATVWSQGWNMFKLDQYDDQSLPAFSGFSYSDCWAWHNKPNVEIAVLGSLDSIHFFEVGSSSFKPIYAYAPGARSLWREFKSYKNYIYSIADHYGSQEGLVVFDLSLAPTKINYVGRDDTTFHKAHMLFIDTATAHLYLAGASQNLGSSNWDLLMYDLDPDPAKPRLIARIDLPGNYVHDLFVRNDTAYCSHGYNGLYIYNIDPNGNATELAQYTNYPQSGYNHSSWLNENNKFLVMADETHNTSLKILDVSNLNRINMQSLFRSALLAPLDTMSIPHNPYYKSNTIFASYYHDGVQVWDASNPTNPVKIAYYDTEPNNTNYAGYAGAWGVYPYLPSGKIIVSDMANGLYLLSIGGFLSTEYLNLTAQKASNAVHLEITKEGLNEVHSVAIEKSKDGRSFFPLANIELKEAHTGFYDREDISSYNYYRLKYYSQLEFHFSQTVSVLFEEDNLIRYDYNGQWYWNPKLKESIQDYYLLSMDGKKISASQLNQTVPGVYLLFVQLRNGSSKMEKLIIQ